MRFTLDLFLLCDILCSGRWGKYLCARTKQMNGLRPPLLHPTKDRRLSVLFSSTSKSSSTHHMHDRNTLNPFYFMRLRTTFIGTEGWGGSTTSHFKYHLNSRSLPSRRMRAGILPSLPLSAVNCQPLALSAGETSTLLNPLECAVTGFSSLSTLECAVTKTRSRNSFRMRSYEKRWGERGGSVEGEDQPKWKGGETT